MAVLLPRICITMVAFSVMHIGPLWILRDPNLAEDEWADVVCKHSACDFYRRSQQKRISDQSPCPKPATQNHCFWYVWAWQMSIWSLRTTIQTSWKFSRYRHKKQHKMFDKVTLVCKIQNNWESDMRQESSICFIFSWSLDFSTLILQPVTRKPTEWGTAWCWLQRTNLENRAQQQRSISDFTGHKPHF